MRQILFILAFFMALNLTAQTTVPAGVKSKDFGTATVKPTSKPQTFAEFCTSQQKSLEKKGGTLWQPTNQGQPIYHSGAIVFMVTRWSTKDGVKTSYDQPVVANQAPNKDGKMVWRWKNVPAKDWNLLTSGKTTK